MFFLSQLMLTFLFVQRTIPGSACWPCSGSAGTPIVTCLVPDVDRLKL